MKLAPVTLNVLRRVWEDNDLPGRIPTRTPHPTELFVSCYAPVPKHMRTFLKTLEVRLQFSSDQSFIIVEWFWVRATGEEGFTPVARLYRFVDSWDCTTPSSHSSLPVEP